MKVFLISIFLFIQSLNLLSQDGSLISCEKINSKSYSEIESELIWLAEHNNLSANLLMEILLHNHFGVDVYRITYHTRGGVLPSRNAFKKSKLFS